jgi:hypothetical protein
MSKRRKLMEGRRGWGGQGDGWPMRRSRQDFLYGEDGMPE